ncbi:hypothetical protein [Herbaspirillum huttiense]|uniref:hypothetical protein n=1 Tax=Herbaspirillum huttiense TaxID=863372 RepID=UPI0031CF7DCC
MKIKKYAQALQALSAAGLLGDKDCKEPVKEFIRKATETSSGHTTTHFRSKDVAIAMEEQILNGLKGKTQYQIYCSKNFRHEHVVPCEVLYRMIITLKTASEFEMILRKYAIRATITRPQDERLRKLGLNQKMPPEFLDPTHAYYDDPFCRYKIAEIHGDLEARSTASWI